MLEGMTDTTKGGKPERIPGAMCEGCGNNPCLPDQQEWCLRQELFMTEPDKAKRDALIWDFIVSFRGVMRHLAMKRLGRGGPVEVGELMGHMDELLFIRFRKAMDKGTYYRRVKLKGYLNTCIGGEILQLSGATAANRDASCFSLDAVIEARGEFLGRRMPGRGARTVRFCPVSA